jgi:hypothetical protein
VLLGDCLASFEEVSEQEMIHTSLEIRRSGPSDENRVDAGNKASRVALSWCMRGRVVAGCGKPFSRQSSCDASAKSKVTPGSSSVKKSESINSSVWNVSEGISDRKKSKLSKLLCEDNDRSKRKFSNSAFSLPRQMISFYKSLLIL